MTLAVPLAQDRIDHVGGIAAGTPLDALRRHREKVRDGTQGADAVLFEDPALEPQQRRERLQVAVYGAALSQANALVDSYAQQARQAGVSEAHIAALSAGDASVIAEPALKAALDYTATLLLRPLAGDQQALQQLQQAGMDTDQIVALSQLVAFLSFQVRMLAGLRALSELEPGA